MENIYFKYGLLFFCFSLGVVLGQVFLSSANIKEEIVSVSEKNPDAVSSDVFLEYTKRRSPQKLWGTLDSVNLEERFIILNQPVNNTFFQVSEKIKIYFDSFTHISARDKFSISNKIFYYDKDISFLNKLFYGDFLNVYVQSDKEGFYATRIIQYNEHRK